MPLLSARLDGRLRPHCAVNDAASRSTSSSPSRSTSTTTTTTTSTHRTTAGERDENSPNFRASSKLEACAMPGKILRDGGLPLATPRSPHGPSVQALAAAVRDAIAEDPRGREADALVAYVRAWEHHWPASFRSALAS